MKRPSNDDVNPIFDWLYLGGIRNTRKTLPLVSVWYDFKWEQPRIPFSLPEGLIYHPIPFDDGDLEAAIPVWEKCHEEIQEYRKQGKIIFISCYEGVSRSAVLTLWLACEEFQDYELALKHVKSCRNIFPDKAFHPFLEELKAKYTNKEM